VFPPGLITPQAALLTSTRPASLLPWLPRDTCLVHTPGHSPHPVLPGSRDQGPGFYSRDDGDKNHRTLHCRHHLLLPILPPHRTPYFRLAEFRFPLRNPGFPAPSLGWEPGHGFSLGCAPILTGQPRYRGLIPWLHPAFPHPRGWNHMISAGLDGPFNVCFSCETSIVTVLACPPRW